MELRETEKLHWADRSKELQSLHSVRLQHLKHALLTREAEVRFNFCHLYVCKSPIIKRTSIYLLSQRSERHDDRLQTVRARLGAAADANSMRLRHRQGARARLANQVWPQS